MFFRGEHVNLRAVREDDLGLIAEYMNDSELMLLLEDDVAFPTSRELQKEWFDEYLKKKNGDIQELAIETKDGKYLGSCLINRRNKKNRDVGIGIFIGDKEYQGKGYGTEAMLLLLDYIFREMNINRAGLNVFSFNTRAIRCYEKCGFKLEVVSREGLYRNGKYHDIHIMGLLREEYFTNCSAVQG